MCAPTQKSLKNTKYYISCFIMSYNIYIPSY